MSELIVSPGSEIPADFGLLQINSEQPVTLINSLVREPFTASGTITAKGSSVNDSIQAISQTDSTIFTMEGSAGDDTLTSAAGADTLLGEDGNDLIKAGAGNDFLSGGVGSDTLFGEDGDDIIVGDLGGNDVISGGAGNDFLKSRVGKDQLDGGIGNDTLQAGGGQDILTGGEGKDVFILGKGGRGGKRPNQVDVIKDFTSGEDVIQLKRNLLKRSGLNVGELPEEAFQVVEQIDRDRQNDSDEAKLIYERSTGLLYYNPDKGADKVLLKLENSPLIASTDFEIL